MFVIRAMKIIDFPSILSCYETLFYFYALQVRRKKINCKGAVQLKFLLLFLHASLCRIDVLFRFS